MLRGCNILDDNNSCYRKKEEKKEESTEEKKTKLSIGVYMMVSITL